jgi:hypothetical protein
MNIQTVITNLRNTIAGKEKMLTHMNEYRVYASEGQVMAHNATVEFLKINIDELKRILQDLEVCIPGDPHSNMPEGWRISK